MALVQENTRIQKIHESVFRLNKKTLKLYLTSFQAQSQTNIQRVYVIGGYYEDAILQLEQAYSQNRRMLYETLLCDLEDNQLNTIEAIRHYNNIFTDSVAQYHSIQNKFLERCSK